MYFFSLLCFVRGRTPNKEGGDVMPMRTFISELIDNREGGGIGNARTSMRRMLVTVT